MVIRAGTLFCVLGSISLSSSADEQQFSFTDVVTSVPQNCLFMSLDTQSTIPARVTDSEDGLLISLGDIVDPETAELQPFAINISVEASCNFKHQVVVRSLNGGLQNSSSQTEGSGFSNRADYTVDASWADEDAQFQTSGAPGEGIGIDVGGGFAGRLDLGIGSVGNINPLTSGEYADAILIEISSAL